MLEFIVVLLCLFCNSFFAAFEMAFVTVSKEDFAETPDKFKSFVDRILNLKKNPERTLSVIQIGISLVGALSAAVGGNGAVESLGPLLEQKYNLTPTMSEALSVVAVIIPLTYLSVVFGELVPKSIALNNPQPILIIGINILTLLDKILSPIITFLELSTSMVLKILRIKNINDEVDGQSSVTISFLPRIHQMFVLNLVELHHKKASDSMIKWDNVIYLNFSDEEDRVMEIIKLSAHTRFPVIDGDTIVGLLHSKDFFHDHRNKNRPWQSILRPVQSFSPKEKLLNIFLKLQDKKQHLAIITEEEKQINGIITIEDIFEEIVGDIYDEVEDSQTL